MSSPLLVLLSLFLILSPPFSFSVANASIKLRLIHIDNPASPYRTSYDSLEHKLKKWEEMSQRRFSQIYNDLVAAKEENKGSVYHPGLTVDPIGIFLAKMGVGIPPKEQFLILDTGSTVTWVTCGHSEFQRGDYDFNVSSTGHRVLCLDSQCGWIPYHTCFSYLGEEACGFSLRYASGNKPIEGSILTETFVFFHDGEKGDQSLIVPSLTFGCGDLKEPIYPGFSGTGVLALSNGRASLASQLGSSYSYCIGNILDVSYPFNSLTLGIGSLVGKSTPILNIANKIFVTIKSIKVGGETLAIDPSIFRRNEYVGGTIMDSGSTSTFLLDEAYNVLKVKLAEKMKPLIPNFCFRRLEAHQVPEVQLVFEGGAVLSLGGEALFGSLDPARILYCFTGIKPSSSSGLPDPKLSIIGINAQQNHNIGYDYDTKKMYIQEVACDYV